MKPAVAVERLFGGDLIVEIAQHQAGAAAADLTDLAECRLGIRIVLAPDPDLEAGAAAPGGLDDQTRIVIRQCVLM